MLAQVAQVAQIYEKLFTVNGLRPCQQANPVWHRWHEHAYCGAWAVGRRFLARNHGTWPNARIYASKQAVDARKQASLCPHIL